MPYTVAKGGGTCGSGQWAVVNKQNGKTAGCHATEASAKKQLAALAVNVTAKEATMPKPLRETTPLGEANISPSGRMRVHAITAGQGSSGYYSPDVLREAAANKLIAAGTPLFFDHPSEADRTDRPERSVRDIAAVFTSEATYDETDQALVGDIQVFKPYRELLTEMAPHIGLSIHASATDIVEGTVEGIYAIDSVDWVTRAGRGGKVVALLESAIDDARRRAEDDPATAGLAMSVGAAAGVAAGLHERLTEQVAKFDQLIEAVTNHDVPATRPDSTTTTEETLEVTMGKIQVEESEHTRLVEQAGRVDTLISERDTEKARADAAEQKVAEAAAKTAEEAAKGGPRTPRQVLEDRDKDLRHQVATLNARERARTIIDEELAEAWLAPSTVARLRGELLEALPLVEDSLDETGLRTRCVERRDQHELEAAEALDAAGVGAPRGLGALRSANNLDESKSVEKRKSFFQTTFGLSESAAETAAKGR